jgi:hypothetical protein
MIDGERRAERASRISSCGLHPQSIKVPGTKHFAVSNTIQGDTTCKT